MTVMEKSCGAVIVKNENGKLHTLMIRQNQGHWCFPKGHVEGNETEHETARREVKEETGIEIEFIGGFRESVMYSPKENTMKEVVYFLAVPCGGEEKRQIEEISEIVWADVQEAQALLTYENDQELYRKAVKFLKEHEEDDI